MGRKSEKVKKNSYNDKFFTPEGGRVNHIFDLQESRLARNEPPLDFFNDLISLTPPVIFDNAGWSKTFGQVLREPQDTVTPGDTVSVTFVRHSY